jgi:hypothetical protein
MRPNFVWPSSWQYLYQVGIPGNVAWQNSPLSPPRDSIAEFWVLALIATTHKPSIRGFLIKSYIQNGTKMTNDFLKALFEFVIRETRDI